MFTCKGAPPLSPRADSASSGYSLQVVFDLEWVGSSAGTGAEVERLPGQFGEDVESPAEKPIRAIPVNAGIAARGLASEGVIVVPTDTLYGAVPLTYTLYLHHCKICLSIINNRNNKSVCK